MKSQSSRAFLVPIVLILAAVAFRYLKLAGLVHLPWLENFTPWMALAFTGTLVFPQRVSFLLIPVLLFVIGIAATGLSVVLHWEAVAVYSCFGLVAWLAARLRGKIGLVGTLLGVIGCGIGFYLVTNTVSWLVEPAYAKNLAGWVQALTTGIGLPGLPTTTWFLRQSLLSDLTFSCLLLAAYNTEAAIRRQPAIPVLRAAVA